MRSSRGPAPAGSTSIRPNRQAGSGTDWGGRRQQNPPTTAQPAHLPTRRGPRTSLSANSSRDVISVKQVLCRKNLKCFKPNSPQDCQTRRHAESTEMRLSVEHACRRVQGTCSYRLARRERSAFVSLHTFWRIREHRSPLLTAIQDATIRRASTAGELRSRGFPPGRCGTRRHPL